MMMSEMRFVQSKPMTQMARRQDFRATLPSLKNISACAQLLEIVFARKNF